MTSAVGGIPRSLAALVVAGAVSALTWKHSTGTTVVAHARSQGVGMHFIGHRGASAVAPENTLKAVRMALEGGYGFEIDLQVLKDGTVVILHDDTLRRTAAMSWFSWLVQVGADKRALLRRPVSELRLDEARTIEVGDHSHTEPIPTFVEVLQELHADTSRRHVRCFAEIKADGYSSSASFDRQLTEASAAAVVNARILPSQLSFISFSLGALLDTKRRLPEHAAYLVAYVQTAAQAMAVAELALQSGLDGIDLNADPTVVTAELADWLHARGKHLAVWVWAAPGANDVPAVWEHMERCAHHALRACVRTT